MKPRKNRHIQNTFCNIIVLHYIHVQKFHDMCIVYCSGFQGFNVLLSQMISMCALHNAMLVGEQTGNTLVCYGIVPVFISFVLRFSLSSHILCGNLGLRSSQVYIYSDNSGLEKIKFRVEGNPTSLFNWKKIRRFIYHIWHRK